MFIMKIIMYSIEERILQSGQPLPKNDYSSLSSNRIQKLLRAQIYNICNRLYREKKPFHDLIFACFKARSEQKTLPCTVHCTLHTKLY